MIPSDVVSVRKYGGGSYYLPIPKELLLKLGLSEGDRLACYKVEGGLKYLKAEAVDGQGAAPEQKVTS